MFRLTVILMSLFPMVAMAASATLRLTAPIAITLENQTGMALNLAEITGRFSCWTVQVMDQESFSDIEELTPSFGSKLGLNQINVIQTSIQNTQELKLIAPEKRTPNSFSGCQVGAYLAVEFAEAGRKLEFTTALGEVLTQKVDSDLTANFEKNVKGHFILKLVDEGLSIDHETGVSTPTCSVGLFKKEGNHLVEKGSASGFEIRDCVLPARI